jgi:hypothetical protein
MRADGDLSGMSAALNTLTILAMSDRAFTAARRHLEVDAVKAQDGGAIDEPPVPAAGARPCVG